MNRHERRSDIACFRREASSLLTYLVPADAPLDGHPLLWRAASYWRAGIRQRRSFCPACKANYADGAEPGAFLFATPPSAPTSASVTAFCTACANDLTIAEIERIASRVLQAIIPNGKFEPLDARR